MSKLFMPGMETMPPAQRLSIMRDNADKSETTQYFRDLTPDDLDVKREQLTTNLIDLSILEEELASISEGFKLRMKPKKQQNKTLIEEVKTRKELKEGVVFHVSNHTDGMMETYDESGELIGSRRLRPDEKQGKLYVANAINQ